MKTVHFAFGRSLSRRAFLRGVGVTLGLPLLEAMRPAFAAAAPPVNRRLLAINSMLGVYPEHFFPKTSGADYVAPQYLEILAAFRQQFTVMSGLTHVDFNGGHNSEPSFLTAAPNPALPTFRNSVSLDQYAIERLRPDTRFPCLTLANHENHSISWTPNGVNIPADDKPSKIYARLFIQGTPGEVKQQVRRLGDGRSILDSVSAEAATLERDVGAADRDKLDQYFTAVRETERRLAANEAWAQKPKPKVEMPPPSDPPNSAAFIATLRPMFDMLHLAFVTDSTRFATLRLNGNISPAIPGVKNGWHDLSHHGMDEGKVGELTAVDRAIFGELRDFLAKLAASAEDGATLLDRSMVFFGSNLGNGSNHSNRNLPVLLAGGGFKHGQHLAFDPEKAPPLADLFVTMLQRLGVETAEFASGKARIPGLELV